MVSSPVVFVEELEGDGDALYKQIMRSFPALSFERELGKANAVFIKPNLTYPYYREGVVTRVEFIEGLVSAIREINKEIKIYIGDGEGGYNSFSMTGALEEMGFFDLAKKYKDVIIVNLSELPSRECEISTFKGPYTLRLPDLFFEEIDFSISCPVPKVHCMTKVTLAYKNLWGCQPDALRLENHYMFSYLIAKIAELLKFKYAFLDGKYGLDDNGPMQGTAIEVGWFVASNSLSAFDMVVSEMMGFNWEDIDHLKMADQYGLAPKRGDISILGNVGLGRDFRLKRNFWNYPALLAFHSKSLTELFYCSRFSGILHDLMYMIRKRPIEEKHDNTKGW
jgi:uncharacterized protein (DUF362 family)